MYNIAANNFVISPYYGDTRLLVKDALDSEKAENIKKNVETGDYFGRIAMALDLTREIMSIIEQNVKGIRQSAEDIEQVNERNIKKLQLLKDDLIFLQKKYKIVKK